MEKRNILFKIIILTLVIMPAFSGCAKKPVVNNDVPAPNNTEGVNEENDNQKNE